MNARLDFLSGSKSGTSIRLLDPELTIGRARDQAIRFSGNEIVISVQHAVLTRQGSTYSIRDMGSKNGTLVNGEPVTERLLADRDEVQFGAGGPRARFRLTEGKEYDSTIESGDLDHDQPDWDLIKWVKRHVREVRVVGMAAFAGFVLVASTLGWREWIRNRNERELARLLAVERASRDSLERAMYLRLDSLGDLVETERARIAATGVDLNALGRLSNGVALVVFAYGYVDRASGEWLRQAVTPDGRTILTEGPGNDSVPELVIGGSGPEVLEDGSATGFLIDPSGVLVTNRHVAEPWSEDPQISVLRSRGLNVEGRIFQMRAYFPPGNRSYDFRVTTVSPDADVALLETQQGPVRAPALPLAPLRTTLGPGEQLIYLGYPAGAENLMFRVANRDEVGVIVRSAKTERELAEELARRRLIQPLMLNGLVSDTTAVDIVHTAPTTAGGSGGPLIGSRGTVVGVHYGAVTPFRDRSFSTHRAVPFRRVWELLGIRAVQR